jgi:pimeloyl-ACP methyl ester carboxylesterase
MQRGLRASTLLAMTLAACSVTTDVRSTRADPSDAATVPSSEPADTTVDPTTTVEPTDTTVTAVKRTLDWAPCNDPSAQNPLLECATLPVPLDYDKPTGDSVDMALVQLPASGDRQGAVLFNPGGPGASGFDPIAFSGTAIAAALGLEAFDLIGFDPRGVDRSGGIRCVTDEFQDKHLYVDDSPDTPEEQALYDESKTGLVDACAQKYGDTLRFYSTENTARDMDAIRDALGDEQISYLGISYGTYLGATYATMFPDHVRAMVLDSAFEPNGDTVEQQFETQLVGVENAFNNWVSWCQGETTCDFTAADVGARWDALKQQLDATPIAAPDGRLANNATMRRATIAALYSESDWPVLAKALTEAEQGNPAGIFALADTYNRRNDDGTFNTLFQSFRVIKCASGVGAASPDDPDALVATLHAAAPRFAKDLTVDDLTSEADACAKMVGDTKPVELSYSGDGPIVVVGGANDPATPIRWAQEMTAELGPNARMVTFTGEGHGQLLVSICVTDIEGALLADLTLPEPDTVCDPDPVVEKPEWWDALPVPEGISGVASLPALAAALNLTPTQIFSEMRTTTLSADDAVAAYTKVLSDAGFAQFDAPPSLAIDDTAQSAYSSLIEGNTLVVIALGPKAFEDKALASAKAGVPADTTVIMLFALQI